MKQTYSLRLITILAALGGCSSSDPPAVPDMPSYETHVKPIFVANCVRCHGAGGMLNGELGDGGEVINVATGGYFDHYEDQGDCDPDGGVGLDCKRGAHTYAVPPYRPILQGYLHPASDLDLRMPPPPAAPLSARDLMIVDRWLLDPIP